MTYNPFFSIVVVSYNAENEIKNTLQSIINQTFDSFEIIIQDSCSTDATLACIPNDGRIHVYSEKDTGIYDGMNKALKKCKGRYVLFLNCGDSLYSEKTLDQVNIFIINNEYPDIVYGDYSRGEEVIEQPSILTKEKLVRKPICHQTMYFSVTELLDGNFYNTEYKLCADYELTFKLFMQNKSFAHIKAIVCKYKGGGISETMFSSVKDETMSIKKHYLSSDEVSEYIKKNNDFVLSVKLWLMSDNRPVLFRKLLRCISNKMNK